MTGSGSCPVAAFAADTLRPGLYAPLSADPGRPVGGMGAAGSVALSRSRRGFRNIRAGFDAVTRSYLSSGVSVVNGAGWDPGVRPVVSPRHDGPTRVGNSRSRLVHLSAVRGVTTGRPRAGCGRDRGGDVGWPPGCAPVPPSGLGHRWRQRRPGSSSSGRREEVEKVGDDLRSSSGGR